MRGRIQVESGDDKAAKWTNHEVWTLQWRLVFTGLCTDGRLPREHCQVIDKHRTNEICCAPAKEYEGLAQVSSIQAQAQSHVVR